MGYQLAYVDDSAEDYLKVCFISEPDLSLQTPSNTRSLNYLEQDALNNYVPLEEVTEISLDELYTNLQGSSEPCFEIANPDV